MKKAILHITVAVGIIFTMIWSSSCNKDLELPPVGGSKKITMLGELVVGDSFFLRAGQSIALASNSTLRFQLLQDLAISVKDSTGKTFSLNGYVAVSYTHLDVYKRQAISKPQNRWIFQ